MQIAFDEKYQSQFNAMQAELAKQSLASPRGWSARRRPRRGRYSWQGRARGSSNVIISIIIDNISIIMIIIIIISSSSGSRVSSNGSNGSNGSNSSRGSNGGIPLACLLS